jgi:hypothetical protein
MSLMEPLRQAPQVIPQIILSLCAISIVTFNKLSEEMTPFYRGNKNRLRINVTTGDKTVLKKLFWENDLSHCIKEQAVLLQTDVFELPMTIRGRSFLHPVTVVENIKHNIIGIDFMHANRMNYYAASKQITFAHMLTNTLYPVQIPCIHS